MTLTYLGTMNSGLAGSVLLERLRKWKNVEQIVSQKLHDNGKVEN